MFSNDYKAEMIQKFNLTESMINSPKHYKIPNFVYKTKNAIDNQCEYHHPPNSLFKLQLQSHPDLLMDKSNIHKYIKTNYSDNKKKNIRNLLTKVQREKVDLLIKRAYHDINNKIREYNKSVSLPKNRVKLRLKLMPLITKEKIIDHVMGQVQKYLPSRNKTSSFDFYGNDYSSNKRNLYKQFIWSHNFMEEKKMEDYQKRYKIKYITNTKNEIIDNNFMKKKPVKDKDIPTVLKINSEMFFSTQKFRSFHLNKNSNKLNKTHQLFES
jgi:hypothetical protein